MSDLDGFHPQAFTRADPEPDALFYASPRFVEHLDAGAIAAVTQLYRTVLPEGGTVLDLMSSWISHLPPEMDFERVIGHGMNQEELDANERLDERFVRDLNLAPSLPLADRSLDAALCCAAVQYLTAPVGVFREVKRMLRPGAPFVITFSDRFFPTKAVALWQALDDADRLKLLDVLLKRAGFDLIETGSVLPPPDDPAWRDPIHAVVARVSAEPDQVSDRDRPAP
ncbi:class I SAM-dependent methyltransferase [Rhizosaccharibacter radicis]|uniref:Class I SAM-dependent methyltransferase n=1 Tax=Rhizosaccharibacter radicis TaxID=2782605 RepID=A0ABT1W0W6_9PROT|nr:class I SAM-dependent methyltransferase [Acetobacteraceae bacterium KSS12]